MAARALNTCGAICHGGIPARRFGPREGQGSGCRKSAIGAGVLAVIRGGGSGAVRRIGQSFDKGRDFGSGFAFGNL